jgi:hypothetical protein
MPVSESRVLTTLEATSRFTRLAFQHADLRERSHLELRPAAEPGPRPTRPAGVLGRAPVQRSAIAAAVTPGTCWRHGPKRRERFIAGQRGRPVPVHARARPPLEESLVPSGPSTLAVLLRSLVTRLPCRPPDASRTWHRTPPQWSEPISAGLARIDSPQWPGCRQPVSAGPERHRLCRTPLQRCTPWACPRSQRETSLSESN